MWGLGVQGLGVLGLGVEGFRHEYMFSDLIVANSICDLLILNAARRPPRPGRMLGGKHAARSGAFAFAGYRGAASTG